MLNYLIKISKQSVDLVNSQQKVEAATREILIPRSMRKIIIEIARQSSIGGLSAGGLGEISARLPGNRFAINALDIAFNGITEKNFSVVALHEDKPITDLAPARHFNWHRLIYSATPAKFILLCQPVYAMVMAESMRLPEAKFMLDAPGAVGGVAVSDGNESEICALAVEHHAVLIQGYGLLVWSEDDNVNQISAQAEIVNRWCQISLKGT